MARLHFLVLKMFQVTLVGLGALLYGAIFGTPVYLLYTFAPVLIIAVELFTDALHAIVYGEITVVRTRKFTTLVVLKKWGAVQLVALFALYYCIRILVPTYFAFLLVWFDTLYEDYQPVVVEYLRDSHSAIGVYVLCTAPLIPKPVRKSQSAVGLVATVQTLVPEAPGISA